MADVPPSEQDEELEEQEEQEEELEPSTDELIKQLNAAEPLTPEQEQALIDAADRERPAHDLGKPFYPLGRGSQ